MGWGGLVAQFVTHVVLFPCVFKRPLFMHRRVLQRDISLNDTIKSVNSSAG